MDGKDIKIGVDSIDGSNSAYILPEGLIYYLEDYRITSLADAHFNGTNYISQQYHLSIEELELKGDWKVMWNNYIGGLSLTLTWLHSTVRKMILLGLDV